MKAIDYRGCLSVEFEAFDYYDATLQKDLSRAAELFCRDFQSLNGQFG